jgi:hypothetical protein
MRSILYFLLGKKIDAIDEKIDDLNFEAVDVSEIKEDTTDIKGKIGENTQLWGNASKTLLGYSNAAYKHIHNPGHIYPADGTTITVTTSATEKTFGNFVDLIPKNTINKAFDIHWISITNINVNGVYVLELHKLDDDGNSEGLLSQVPCVRADNFSKVGEVICQIPVQAPNTRVGIRALKGTDGTGNVSIISHYHNYE